MKVVTLRNIPPELGRIIRRKAREKKASVNKTVISLLEEGVGIGRKKTGKPLHHDLDELAGSWTKEETEAFERALIAQRPIDQDLWK
ncbi:MAG: hypothetical protein HYV08_11900 [Deltaproteobacteria bacterium]|nr:hypothetical protein [Deltaproteobacteria bacterium]